MSSSDDYSMMDAYAKVHLGKTPRQLSEMSESELAVWQSTYSPSTPQWSMADREWQRRLIVEQLNAILESNAIARDANTIALSAAVSASDANTIARSAKREAARAAWAAIVAAIVAAISIVTSNKWW